MYTYIHIYMHTYIYIHTFRLLLSWLSDFVSLLEAADDSPGTDKNLYRTS